ncbi:acidic mammalian chitinase-like [Ruditapes philippinarum]|uniref:acidic mammalian chitinase-like n=1 Tax=Ruditapes philippinarum TaxID=129788 RepID=UPI00295BFD1E|nr:acidic mammalian chitinase-like [Ruditapes philippinarum]XP_060586212.1 acidic mammalian chitinase-like [Ruditapes philippinarum]
MALGIEWLLILGALGVGQIYVSYLYLFNVTPEKKFEVPLLCYFALEADWPDNGTLHPAMNATLCTHLIMISSHTKDCILIPASPDDPHKYFRKIPILRKQNPKLKIMLSNGGGGPEGMTEILGSEANTTKYINSILPFMKKYDFDGIDMDWEFPGWNGLPKGQRGNFTKMLQNVRNMFDTEEKKSGRKYLLSAAVAAGRAVMEIYDVPALARSLDFINLMCYDYHAYAIYDPVTGYNSPLYPTDWQKKIVIRSGNVGWSSYEWHKRGMPKSKIMVGIPTYTHTWTLEKPDIYHGHDAPATGPGKGCDECSYPWVCEFLKSGATDVFDTDAAVPYAYNGDQWVSYDNVNSLIMKSEWILQNGFGGIMVFFLNADDLHGVSCSQGKFPLISAIKKTIENNTNSLI